ncbi:MAG: glycoside hydrolase family 2 TIM barrel-domain containing protein [Bacteroidota bacterium]
MSRRFPALFLLALFPPLLFCQHLFLESGAGLDRTPEAGFLVDTPTREKIDLSGVWSFQVRGGPSGSVRVPSAYDFVGDVEFTRRFSVTAEQLEKYDFHLVLLGVNHHCEVSVNAEFVTNHSGGYTSFIAAIPPRTIQMGTENVIKVSVANDLDTRKTIPLRSLVWGWRNYGGILRDVYIIAVPRFSVADIVARALVEDGGARARVRVRASFQGRPGADAAALLGDGKGVAGFYVEMLDKIAGVPIGRSPVVPVTGTPARWEAGEAEVVMTAPRLWSPESPDLYVLRCCLVVSHGPGKERTTTLLDQYEINYGLREIRIADGSLLLNGKRLILQGVVWLEDHPVWGGAMPPEALEKDIVLLKNLGANAVRFGNHPPHPYVLDLCDRYGLLALVDFPVVRAPGPVLAQEDYLEQAGGLLREMILRDRNHPCVLAWGAGDELDVSHPAGRAFVQSLLLLAGKLDERPLYAGTRMVAGDVCTDLLDIAALNAGAGDLKEFRRELAEWKRRHPGKPVVVARFGAEVQQGNRNGYSDPLSHEAQARFYIQRFDALRDLDYDGAFVWSLNDWRGDRPSLTVHSGDPWLHTMGLLSYGREKRLAYEAVRSVFRSEKFVALPIGNFTPGAPIVFVLAGLVVLIGAVWFYNGNRRFRENLNRSVMNSYNFFADVRDQRLVSLVHSTLLGLIAAAALAIVIAGFLHHERQSLVLDNLLSYLLVSDTLKELLVRLVWRPLDLILALTVIFFGLLLVGTGITLAVSPLLRSRMYPFHAYAVTMWATPPLLVLVPVGMVLYRVLDSQMYALPALLLVAGLCLWVLARVLKGVAIVCDVLPFRMYLLGFLSVAGVLGIGYAYYDYSQAASVYVSFLLRLMTGSQ